MRRPDLLGAMRGKRSRVASEELLLQLEAAEQKAEGEPKLWAREFAAVTVRALSRSLVDTGEDAELRTRLIALRDHLRELDDREYVPLRDAIRAGVLGPNELFADLDERPAYEWDAHVERLLDIHEVPSPQLDRQDNMVHYLASPVASILDMVPLLGPDDVLYDMGSGLGKVPLLVAWLSGATSKGVELEPEYAKVAVMRAEQLGFERAMTVCADARSLDYEDATAVYFYDPFRGDILEAVLAKLKTRSEERPLTVFSRGFSTGTFMDVPWLRHERTTDSELAIFVTRV